MTAASVSMMQLGGSGPPPIVTPLVSADFKNGVYAIGGSSAAVTDIFAEDSGNWGTWDPATNVTDGVGATGGAPVVKHPLVADLLPSGVIVFTWTGAESGMGPHEILDFPGYTTEWVFEAGTQTPGEFSVNDYQTHSDSLAYTGGAINKMAIAYSNGELAASVNGSANASTDPTDGSPTDIALSFTSLGGGACTKIEFFSLSDYTAADLPTLSA